ncbi:MAG: hypothetical protein R3C26_03920 [Calditrichia bacterium]
MAFWDAQNGIAFSDPVDGKLLLIRTADGGKTWREFAPDELPATIEGEYAFAASGTCVSVFGENNVWIATGGTAARVFTSTNRGQSWQVFDTKMRSGAPSQGIFSLAFRDALNGVAVGGDYQQPEQPGNTLLRTTDGGKSWQITGWRNENRLSVLRSIFAKWRAKTADRSRSSRMQFFNR